MTPLMDMILDSAYKLDEMGLDRTNRKIRINQHNFDILIEELKSVGCLDNYHPDPKKVNMKLFGMRIEIDETAGEDYENPKVH